MRISGEWRLCDDLYTRPTFWTEMQDISGNWMEALFLADCGADRTVITPDLFATLGFPPRRSREQLGGIGGASESFEFPSAIRMFRADGVPIFVRGQFNAVGAGSELDMNLLGRDITNHFALVVDRPGDAVCLLSRGEVYQA